MIACRTNYCLSILKLAPESKITRAFCTFYNSVKSVSTSFFYKLDNIFKKTLRFLVL